MPKINIDEIVEPIEITVAGKNYLVIDIPRETAREMSRLGNKADALEMEIKKSEEFIAKAKDAGDTKAYDKAIMAGKGLLAREDAEDSTGQLATIMAKVMGADAEDIRKLGMRKLTMLVKKVMGTIGEELDPKNVPKAVAPK